MTVAEKLIEQTGVIGEKLEITAFEKLEAPYVGTYVHINKIAALVGLSSKVDTAEVLGKRCFYASSFNGSDYFIV